MQPTAKKTNTSEYQQFVILIVYRQKQSASALLKISCFVRISMNNLKDIAGIISYDIADYGMHLSHKRLFRQFLQQGKFDKQNESLQL